jgi:hypothetical protein
MTTDTAPPRVEGFVAVAGEADFIHVSGERLPLDRMLAVFTADQVREIPLGPMPRPKAACCAFVIVLGVGAAGGLIGDHPVPSVGGSLRLIVPLEELKTLLRCGRYRGHRRPLSGAAVHRHAVALDRFRASRARWCTSN